MTKPVNGDPGCTPMGQKVGRMYLGDHTAVAMLIAEFLRDSFEQRQACLEGQISADYLKNWAQNRANDAAKPFLGLDDRYQIIAPEWNSPDGGLVAHIEATYRFKPGGDPHIVVRLVFLIALNEAVEALDRMGPGTAHNRHVQHVIHTSARILTGCV